MRFILYIKFQLFLITDTAGFAPTIIKGIKIGKVFFWLSSAGHIGLTADPVCMGRKSCQYNYTTVLQIHLINYFRGK